MKKVLLFILIFFSFSFVQAKNINIYLFHNESCTHCQAEIEFLEELSKTREITLYKYEVSQSRDNQKILTEVRDLFKNKENLVPFTIIGSETFTGFNSVTKSKILETIDYYDQNDYCDKTGVYLKKVPACEVNDSKDTSSEFDLPIIGKVDAKKFSLPIISVVIGLVDGFNPCAMWVLIFLIGMLFNMEDKKRMWILGYTFLFASSIFYFFAVFFLDVIVGYMTVKIIRYLIGVVGIIGGLYNLYKYYTEPKDGCSTTSNTEKKKIMTKIRKFTSEKNIFLALIGVIVLAVSVNLVEIMCTTGFPTIFVSILELNNITGVTKIIYLLVYILMYMIDDLVVFIVSMVTLEVTGISTKYNRLSHLVGGILMVLIGILLIFKYEWLMFNF